MECPTCDSTRVKTNPIFNTVRCLNCGGVWQETTHLPSDDEHYQDQKTNEQKD